MWLSNTLKFPYTFMTLLSLSIVNHFVNTFYCQQQIINQIIILLQNQQKSEENMFLQPSRTRMGH